jgi:U3 small nucleolar ribonucleoprotein protein IMP3
MRPLKHHEAKLLKKVDFLSWQTEENIREGAVLRRYGLNHEEYHAYNKVVGLITALKHKLQALPADNPFRVAATEALMKKLYDMGLLPSASSALPASGLSVSALARRRLPIMLVRMKYAQTLKDAIQYVEHGHIRVGPEVVTDPAFIVTRSMEDFVRWTDSSAIKRTVTAYNDRLDDYELLGE